MINYIEKINDFKKCFKVCMNPTNDPLKNMTIDALFDNVRIIYEEYKDSIQKVSVKCEPYRYHILKPVNGYYDLLDYLLNKAISNLLDIRITKNTGNLCSDSMYINIDQERYNGLRKRKSSEVVSYHQRKTCYHETLHSLTALINNEGNNQVFCEEKKFRERVDRFYYMLRNKYPNLLSPNDLKGAIFINYPSVRKTRPFQHTTALQKEGIAFEECVTEGQALINSGLESLKQYEGIMQDDTHVLFVPNYENMYAHYQLFPLFMKTLVSKESFFRSMFLHTDKVIEDFANQYASAIMKNADFSFKGKNAYETINNIFKEIYNEILDDKKMSYVPYNSLARIFYSVYSQILSNDNINFIDTDTLKQYTEVLRLAVNQMPYVYRNGKYERESVLRIGYKELYDICKEELKRRESDIKSR